MELNSLFGTVFQCECGKVHSVPVRDLIYSESALADLPGILDREADRAPARVCLFADKRTYGVAARACEESLAGAGKSVQTIIVPDIGGEPRCDDITRDALAGEIKPCDIFLAAGSGVINDLVKWLACTLKTPYAAVATAASMNGYASKNIAPAIKGIKRVIPGTTPLVIAAVPSIIEKAPFVLTASGLGDVLAKPVSGSDWLLNKILFDDYYCSFCAGLIRDLEPLYIEQPERIKARDPDALQALFNALIFSGVSMTMADTSSPASGGEHMISHTLDMTASAGGFEHDYHGRQVGLGAIFACALYERVLDIESPCFRLNMEPVSRSFWKGLEPVIEQEYELKRHKALCAFTRLGNRDVEWDDIRSALKPFVRRALEIKKCLRTAGAAHEIEHIGCSRDRFLQAALYCHQARERYTIMDLAGAVGVMPSAAEEIIEEHLI